MTWCLTTGTTLPLALHYDFATDFGFVLWGYCHIPDLGRQSAGVRRATTWRRQKSRGARGSGQLAGESIPHRRPGRL